MKTETFLAKAQKAWREADKKLSRMSDEELVETLVDSEILTKGSHRVRKHYSRVIQADSARRQVG